MGEWAIERERDEARRDQDRLDAQIFEAGQALVNVDPADWEVAAKVFDAVVDAAHKGSVDGVLAVINEVTPLVRGERLLDRTARLTAALHGLPLVAEHEWGIGESDD